MPGPHDPSQLLEQVCWMCIHLNSSCRLRAAHCITPHLSRVPGLAVLRLHASIVARRLHPCAVPWSLHIACSTSAAAEQLLDLLLSWAGLAMV